MARPANPEAPHRLLAAARAAFAAVGVDAARIEDIARAAGFSKAAFYLYFESKEVVFAALVRDMFAACLAVSEQRQAAIDALVADAGGATAGDWAAHTDRLLRFQAIDHDYSVRTLSLLWDWRDVFATIEQATGPRRAVVEQLLDMTRVVVADRLAGAAAADMLRADIDPELAAEMILGIYLQLARRMLRLPTCPDLAAWARQIDALISSGIHPTSPAAPAESPC
jgi:AcrR family transcriptional regulator